MTERDKKISDNLGLVHACCRRFVGRGVEYDDLYQAGCVGLVKAVDNFDESRNLQLSTYAVPVILGELKRLFREGGSVKVSRPLKELAMRASRTGEALTKQLGRTPTVSELAKELGVTSEEAAEAVCAARPAVSLTAGEDGEPVELDLKSEDESGKICEKLSIESALARLNERDRRLIRLRYFGEKTQSQTAAELGMTQVQVSRREKAVLADIRRYLDCG